MANPQPDLPHFKSERLRFLLCVIREVRLAFQAAVDSRWIIH